MPKRLLGAVLLAGLGLVLQACGNKDGDRVINLRPFVKLTGGPVEGDSVSYTSEFLWTGWDEDDIIDHYQYSIDIPETFTMEDINNPQDLGIAWTDTTAFRARFRFTTPTQDTIVSAGGNVLPERYRGDHTFYIRAVDNEGSTSTADFLSFTARTITPKTLFTIPRVARNGQVLSVGRQINVAWEGVDPDNPDPRRRPAFYEWKLVQLRPGGSALVPPVEVTHQVLISPGPDFPWFRVGADTTSLRVNLNPPNEYVFAVRAIDEAGGVESRFLRGGNAAVLLSLNSNPGSPILTIREKALGSWTFPSQGEVVEYEVPVGRCLVFDLSATAEDYGGVIQGFNYGVDVQDVDRDDPASGFTGYFLTPARTFTPICFDTPGNHTLTIKCRDTGGGITIGTVILKIIAFPQDREVLYIDDYAFCSFQGVTDALMDNRVRTMLEDVGFAGSDVTKWDVFGDCDLNIGLNLVKLSDLSRYKYVLWSVNGGLVSINLLVTSSFCTRILQSYVSAGGAAWFYGQQVYGSFRQFGAAGGDCKVDTRYDENIGLQYGLTDFPCQYMNLCQPDARQAKFQTNTHGMLRGTPNPKHADEFFPPLEVDSTLFRQAGIPFVEAIFQPTFVEGLDTLYTFVAANSRSPFTGKPAAIRYRDPSPTPAQGPVALCGFPFHLLKPGSADVADDPSTPDVVEYRGTGVHGMAASMFNWFRTHQRSAKAYLSP